MRYLAATFSIFLCLYSAYAESSKESSITLNQAQESIASKHWPTFVVGKEPIVTEANKTVPANYRGTLIRHENGKLIVDFGRHGVHHVNPEQTDFSVNVEMIKNGQLDKEYPNLTYQIGNKLIAFSREIGEQQIRLQEVAQTKVYIFIYLNTFEKEHAESFVRLGEYYLETRKDAPETIAVILTKDRAYYDFAYTVGHPIPLITPHFRKGYINSFDHGIEEENVILACDANGQILFESPRNLEIDNLQPSLEEALAQVKRQN